MKKLLYFSVFACLMVLLTSCGSFTHLPTPKKISSQVGGSKIRLSTSNQKKPISGELIATDDSLIYIAQDEKLHEVPIQAFKSADVFVSKPVNNLKLLSFWGRLLPFTSITHGWFGFASLPVNSVPLIMAYDGLYGSQYLPFRDSVNRNRLNLYSRFPEGIPDVVSKSQLKEINPYLERIRLYQFGPILNFGIGGIGFQSRLGFDFPIAKKFRLGYYWNAQGQAGSSKLGESYEIQFGLSFQQKIQKSQDYGFLLSYKNRTVSDFLSGGNTNYSYEAEIFGMNFSGIYRINQWQTELSAMYDLKNQKLSEGSAVLMYFLNRNFSLQLKGSYAHFIIDPNTQPNVDFFVYDMKLASLSIGINYCLLHH